MKKRKKLLVMGMSLFMLQSTSYAQENIPEQVFVGLSAVIDNIKSEEDKLSAENGSSIVLPSEDSAAAEGDFKERLKYDRDRNHSNLSINIGGLSEDDVHQSGDLISIDLSSKILANSGLRGPVNYRVEKNDRLIRYFEFVGDSDSGELHIYLMDNVDYSFSATAGGLKLNFSKRTSAIPKIVIDPGHGGKDPGAYSQTIQTQEKALALRTALLVRDKLASRGYDVTMTRDSDWYPTLQDRSGQANNLDVDVFISIHYNSAGTTSAAGIETFAYFTDDNRKLAEAIQAELIASTGATNRGVKNGNKLIVLNTTKVPAALLELGFLSNPNEAKKISEEYYQNTMAEAIATGIDKYFGR